LINRGNVSAALAEIANLLASPGLPPPVTRELSSVRCWVLLLDGQLPRAEQEAARLIDEAARDPELHAARRTLANTLSCAAWLRARPLDALAIAHEFEQPVVDDPLDGRLTSTVWPPLFTLYAEGAEAGRKASCEARARAAARNAQWVMPFHDFVTAGVAYNDGEWDDAAAAFDSGLELARESGSGWLSIAVGCRALIDVHRGELYAARARLAGFARARLPCQFGRDDPGLARLALAEADLQEGAGEDGAALANQAAELWRPAVDRSGLLWLAEIAPYVARLADDALLARMRGDLEFLDSAQLPAHAPVREQIAGMRSNDAAVIWRAAERFQRARSVLAASFAWEEATLVAARIGDIVTARRSLRAALDGYDKLGALSDQVRLRARAGAAGIRPGGPPTRRRLKSGWQSLTPTESTIVEFIREGMTNPEIARRLYLSPRTVQTHVSHILQKTNLRSRVEIAAAGVG
jgi:DNA-binding NarL/FixJ family response regulator